MRILIYLPSPFGDLIQNPDYPEQHPMGGTESTVIRLAHELAIQGIEAKLTSRRDDLLKAAQDHDLILLVRDYTPAFTDELLNKPCLLWCHDDTDQPFLQPLQEPTAALLLSEQLRLIVVPSSYAAWRWHLNLHIPWNRLHIIPNPIPIARFPDQPIDISNRPPHTYYASSPQRGLNILLHVWPDIAAQISDAHLHIASSMRMYNKENDSSCVELIRAAQTLPQTTWYDGLSQAELRNLAAQCRALAYPSIFPETFCIAAAEAMASGCIVASNTLGAIPETAHLNPLSDSTQPDWIEHWKQKLLHIFTQPDAYHHISQRNRTLSSWYNLKLIALQWIDIFNLCLDNTPPSTPSQIPISRLKPYKLPKPWKNPFVPDDAKATANIYHLKKALSRCPNITRQTHERNAQLLTQS